MFCKAEHWSDMCKSYVTTAQRKAYFGENNLCFNCGSSGHRARHCRSRGCYHCGEKHHTSLHDQKETKDDGTVLTGYSTIESLDGSTKEEIELAGSTMEDFTTVKRPNMNKLKWNFEHTKDKRFYMTTDGECPIHMILGDNTFCKIKTEEIYKGKDGDPMVDGTSFGWIVHGGDISNNVCMFTRESNDYEQLYTLDVLGVEDRGENDQLDVYREITENITRASSNIEAVRPPFLRRSVLE